eukprot:465928-Prymnesium_polylepis.2
MVAIKRMDKKLVKHKNRYRSCYAEVACLKAISSPFICALRYTYQCAPPPTTCCQHQQHQQPSAHVHTPTRAHAPIGAHARPRAPTRAHARPRPRAARGPLSGRVTTCASCST